MTRDEIVGIIAEGIAYTRTAVTGIPTEVTDGDRLRGHYAYDALRDAGVIPAEGTVTIARRTESVTSSPIVIPAMMRRHMLDAGADGLVLERARIDHNVESFDGDGPCEWGIVLEFAKDYGDLDAIPAAPTGEDDTDSSWLDYFAKRRSVNQELGAAPTGEGE